MLKTTVRKKAFNILYSKLESVIRQYENFIGLTEVRSAQQKVLELLTDEHTFLKQEKQLIDEFHNIEANEREAFSLLSASLRESHEKERQKSERTKYWSIIGSAFGALVGIIGTTVNNQRRMVELKRIVTTNSLDSSEIQQQLLAELRAYLALARSNTIFRLTALLG
ncbi:Mitochondrial potassium channel [Trichinella spiralis]|uniref:Mitochondrial potassium channel n=1 Tax=Trichinella spiralis TaxID=6334 RepID=A0ABR3K2P7_TRISP